jgi:hypothetical protein
VVFAWHRRQTGGGDIFSAATFGFAFIQALVGFVSQDSHLYLAAPSIENLIYGTAFLGSAAAGHPILALYARRLYPIPRYVQHTETFRRAFLVTSMVWFVGLTFRAALRIWLLVALPLEAYLVVNTVAGWPISVGLVTFTVWYPLRALRGAGLIAGRTVVEGDVEEAVEEAAAGAP